MSIKLLLPVVLFLLFYTTPSIAQTGIFINEAMASNHSTITDGTGDFSDWIEVYNSNSSPVILDGYYITDDASNPIKFRFSGNLQVPANGYLLLWASGDITRGTTHLSFKISGEGENIYLYLPDGVTRADSLLLGQQKGDVSYGRRTDGSPDLGFFAKPTPGLTNNSSIAYTGILNSPVFSANAGFYANPFSLSISSDDPAARIIYTLDGSNPDTGNIKGTVYRYKNKYQQNPGDVAGPFLLDSFRSVNYANSFTINDASVNPNRLCLKSTTTESAPIFPVTLINKATVVRAAAVKDGYISSEINTASYFVTPGGNNKYTLPLISLAIPENQLFSWDSGIHVAGTDFEQWRALNPTAIVASNGPANWNRDVEYPSSLELFTANQPTRELQTNFGLTLNGNSSRSKPQKSFRLYFRSSYGAPDLNYPIFPDLPYRNYERLVLNNSGQDMNATHLRNMIVQSSVKHLRFATEHDLPTITFVNGEFWGLLNTRERFDDNYFDRVYGIKSDELDFLEQRSTVKDGTNIAILDLRNFVTANDMSQPANYLNVQNRMDMDNYIDYQITEIFFGNKDWPHNNVQYFRKRVPYTPGAPYGQDGRFRWVLNDMDVTLAYSGTGGAAYNSLAWATGTRTDVNPLAWSTELLRKLLANTEFRNQFITRYADLNNTTFLPANISSVINYYRDLVTPHISEHIQRWRRPGTVSVWSDSVNSMVQFANLRPFYARQHIRDQFSLSNEQQLTIDVSDSAQGYIRVNTVDITPAFPGVAQRAYPWNGLYYPEVPVTLIAKAKDGYRFSHWEGDSSSTEDTLTVTLSRAMSFKAFFEFADVDTSKVITYWHFNNLPANALGPVPADTSLPGNAVITYEGTGTGFMDRTGITEGSTLNAQFNQPSGYGLRPRNPSFDRFLLIAAPSTGYKNIVLSYATTRTSKGAEYQRVSYTTDNIVWQLKSDSILVPTPETTFGLQTFDFSTDVNTVDNPNFAIKIEFFGTNSTGTSGNDRFDNITISGIRLSTVPSQPTVSVSSDRNSICTNSKVTFTATTTNAGAFPAFQWIKNGVNVGNNSNIYLDSSFQNSDNVYCVLTVNNISINSNKIIIIVLPNSLVINSLTKSSAAACLNDGKITINSSGGTSPFLYSLGNVDYFASNVFTNLTAGTYTAYVTDAKGCSASLTDMLTKTAAIVITGLIKTAASACTADGIITILRTGGTPPFQYSLNNVDYFASNVFSNLAAASYTAYAKDARGCAATPFTDVLTKASTLVITSLSKTSASACRADGIITINRTGGTSPFQYSLDNVNYFPSNVFSNLAAGNYTAYVKDARGCTTTFSDVLTKPAALVITSLTKTPASACRADGVIGINRTGGTSPFQYSLNNVNYFTTNTFSNLAAGNYTAYVKDAKGCTATLSDVLTKASPLTISVSKTNPTACHTDGKITIFRAGGTYPLQYSLNNVNYFTTNAFTNLAAGTYTAYIKDAQACTVSLGNIILTAPACIAARLSKTPLISSTKLSIKAFPNPSKEQFSAIVESVSNREVEVIITDMVGRKLFHKSTAANIVFSIEKKLVAGTYIIEASQGKERATLKIVKVE